MKQFETGGEKVSQLRTVHQSGAIVRQNALVFSEQRFVDVFLHGR
jgi:hypothetical protein